MTQFPISTRPPTGRRMVTTLVVSVAGLATMVVGAPTAAAPPSPVPTVRWQPCPEYSDDEIRARGVRADRIPEFRALLARTECGTVTVPLDYRRPTGRTISIALTRLKATDQKRRLGSIALNPGGPGGPGYLMPIDIVMTHAEHARLNERYDLIGFDPRGVGYSTNVECPPPEAAGSPQAGPLTEEAARQRYDAQVRHNVSCAGSDPEFLGQLTSANVAHDLDRLRKALGERRLSFLGVSWGTRLGMVYRSLYPGKVDRMFLDSVAMPHYQFDMFDDRRTAAAERNFGRMAEWMADHDDVLHFGTSADEVRAAVVALRQSYDDEPRSFTDLPMPVDGSIIAKLASQDSRGWPTAARALAELRDATGPTAPPTVRQIFGGQSSPSEPGVSRPDRFSPTMQQAVMCNEDSSRPDFATAWAAYQRRLAENPVTGRATDFSVRCAGWPLPVQEVRLHRAAGSLVLSGHRYEMISPYEWTVEVQKLIGGTVFTVEDDVHGSVLFEPSCGAELVRYFETGRIGTGCPGAGGPPPLASGGENA
ncbi:alpha/beta fold hydrolase [Micromonospora sp. HM5-17]|uniref:alpha/beta fold hydrolase n=1 Tax=Micromonospora sp. HM5-17 TaxID=2487710 RepID=UPI0018F5E16F|nr:alpha/beta fold hydrolase [Micromonospora sp. HM5-17]